MEGSYENDLSSFEGFLKDFCTNVIEKEDNDDVLPIRLFNSHFNVGELQAECFEWTLRYLDINKCPATLASYITKEVYKEIKKIDFKEFEEKTKDENSEEIQEDSAKQKTWSSDGKSLPVLDASLVLDHVIDIIHEVCKKWAESLPMILVPSSVPKAYYNEIRNTRRKMEDRHVIIPDFNTLFDIEDMPQQSYFAVFDGHAGIEAAVYASTHLHVHLPTCENFLGDPAGALKSSYSATDNMFIKKAEKENLKSGTTGVSVLIRGDKLYTAWLGDSQAVLVRDGEVVDLVNPHKPEREDERNRVESLGGCVLFMGAWRVNGNLAVSRAIGDISQKKYICSDADTITETLNGTEDYIVLGCDGIWDSVRKEDLTKRVHNHLMENGGDKSTVAKDLVTWAKECGSSDNITVIVVFLRDEIASPKIKPIFNFGATPSSQERDEEGEGHHQDKSSEGNSRPESKETDNLNTSSQNSSHQPKEHDIIDQVEVVLTPTQECLESNLQRNINSQSANSSVGRISTNADQSDMVLDSHRIDSLKSESVASDSLPSSHRLTKKEPIFMYEGNSAQNTPTFRSISERENAKSTEQELKDSRASSLPGHIFISHQPGTVTEFHQKLKMEGFQESGKKKLPILLEAPVLSDYDLSSDQEREIKKEVKKKKTKRLRKPFKEKDVKDIDSPARSRKKIGHSGPIVWAFTGKNLAPVQNYKLNQAAKTSHSLISPRVAFTNLANHGALDNTLPTNTDIRLLDKLTKSKHFANIDSKNTENVPMPHTVFDYPLSTFTSSLASPTKNVLSSIGSASDTSSIYSNQSKDRASKIGFQPRRPKRTTRFVSGGFTEVPPTPLTNTKILPSTNETVDR